MKIYVTLVSVLAFAASAHPTADTGVNLHAIRQDDAGSYARSMLTDLEAAFTLNNASLPELGFTKEWQYICSPNIWTADQVAFWHTGTIRHDDVRSLTAYYVSHVETTATNTGHSKDVKMVVTKSTTTLQVETKGWTVSAKLSGTGGKKDVAGGAVEVSASYSNTKSNTHTETNTISHEAFCEPGYACRIETWAFHLGLYAKPAHWPYYQLWSLVYGYDDERYLCDMDVHLRDCDQFTDRLNKWCDPKDGGLLDDKGGYWVNMQPKYYDVEIKLPVYEENGFQPMSRVVLVSEPIAKRSRDVSEVAKVGTKKDITEAMAKGIKYQFLD